MAARKPLQSRKLRRRVTPAHRIGAAACLSPVPGQLRRRARADGAVADGAVRARAAAADAEGAPLGDVFSFVSGLYFRGKLAYARRFAQPPDPPDPVAAGGVLVITPNAGLRAADTPVTIEIVPGVCWRLASI